MDNESDKRLQVISGGSLANAVLCLVFALGQSSHDTYSLWAIGACATPIPFLAACALLAQLDMKRLDNPNRTRFVILACSLIGSCVVCVGMMFIVARLSVWLTAVLFVSIIAALVLFLINAKPTPKPASTADEPPTTLA